MLIKVDQISQIPLYQQVHDQIVQGIATGALAPGVALPSVRSLASDLGINLHTVNKAYALLRDEGYIMMRGRLAAIVLDPTQDTSAKFEQANLRMKKQLYSEALAWRARGGDIDGFLKQATKQAQTAFRKKES